MDPAIMGLGTALPPHSVDQDQSAAMAASICRLEPGRERLLPTLYRRSRVRRRGSVLLNAPGDEHPWQRLFHRARSADDGGPGTDERMRHYVEYATPLALQAARRALDDAAVRPAQITDLVTVSCTGFAAPGVDVTLIRQLGLPEDVSRTHVGFMGCHGAFNAIRVARGYVAADSSARVLVCAVELCSLHFAYGWKPQAIVANALFADGAGAVVLGAGNDDTSAWRLAASGSTLLPDSEDAMTWHIRDHGFEMTLSPRVPDLIATHLRPWLEAWLGRQGVAMADVAAWAVHPGGPRVVQSVSEALGIPGDAVADSLAVLCELGNMSSPTILFILQRMRENRTQGPLVALGFGPGLTAEAMLLV